LREAESACQDANCGRLQGLSQPPDICPGEALTLVKYGSVETSMINRKIDRAEWKQFFDFLSKQVEEAHAEIEVASLKLGNQIEAECLPLIGLAYDHKDNSVEVALEASKRDVVDHIIREPREIYFAEDGRQFMGLHIIDLKGARHIVKLKDPLMLPCE
jgi:Family of unknown function (DUF5335)